MKLREQQKLVKIDKNVEKKFTQILNFHSNEIRTDTTIVNIYFSLYWIIRLPGVKQKSVDVNER